MTQRTMLIRPQLVWGSLAMVLAAGLLAACNLGQQVEPPQPVQGVTQTPPIGPLQEVTLSPTPVSYTHLTLPTIYSV